MINRKITVGKIRVNQRFFQCFLLVLFFLLIVIGIPSRTIYAQSNTLLQQVDFIYQGAFRVPQGTFGTSTINYGGTAMAYNPARNSLYIVGHSWDQHVAEISIPEIVDSSNLNSLNTATIIQPFVDALEGRIESINPTDSNQKRIGGLLVYGGELYIAAWSYYDGGGTQSTSHFVRPLDLSVTGQLEGPYRVGNQYPGFVSGYMAAIPQEWQTALGEPSLTGGCCHSIVGLQSLGPAASVFNPTDVGSVNPVPATPGVGYPINHPTLGVWEGDGTPNPIYNMATAVNGVVFPDGTASVVFFGTTGLGVPCYGTGAECNDPARDSKGSHAYPYTAYAWAYDVNDLIAVKNGQKNQWDIVPYANWAINFYFGGASISAVAYDSNTQRVYVAGYCSDGTCYPIIHVFSINSTFPPPTPQPPRNLRIE